MRLISRILAAAVLLAGAFALPAAAQSDYPTKPIKWVVNTHAHFDHMGGLDLFPNATFYIQKRELDKWVWALTLGPEYRFLVGAADPADIMKATRLAREGRMIVVDGDAEDILPGIDLHLAADTHTYGSMYVTIRNDGARDSQDVWVFAGDNIYTYDNLTGLEVLRLFADLKKVPRSACAEILERVGLSHAASRRVRGYSKGMRQRLGFAQVLLGAPDLIFLDEPTNGLDPEGIHDFYQTLRDVQAQGATIIITSHILSEIQERVDALVILNSGKIAAQGTLAQLRAQMVLPSEIRIVLNDGETSGAGSRVHAALAQLAVYLASTAKSNAAYTAFGAAKRDVAEYGTQDVPMHIRNAPTRLMKELGYGSGYQYDHDVAGGVALDQTGFPDAMGERIYYQPTDAGMEARLKEKLDRLRSARERALANRGKTEG